ncbi:Adenosylmethionine-8-amino-7-oxononanoate aminotransferase [Halobacillus alkaliphilus]|uniref:Adenosylmethionine-8-amino-7-oxononanoate aminotransferase n=1 Tax=Halobacillus alkaliphilus TaxID=396056 RepID=A0A1I2N0S2_9BACI|nr:aspartate aminotransferase family protein [Halobacillus alkaliphilus]SFF96479.1 Adenosylmethionine-8-amino-7-oxononanoate aminotransferase [Halobacillus alkaliphilus]
MTKADVKSDLLAKDEKYVWHSMKPYKPEDTMVAKSAKGSWITDVEGNRFLDAMSGLWCVNIGYGREELALAAFDQMKELSYMPMTQSHEPAIQLGEKINQLLGDDYVIFFSNSGSEANEAAFKMVRQYHQQKGDYYRTKFISRYRSYHGNSTSSLAATGQAQRKYKYEPLGPGFLHVAPPDEYRNDHSEKDQWGAQDIDRVMTWEHSESIAGVIMEPIITGGGVIVPPEQYMKEVKAVCERHGALMIVDEVICGFGRTGKPFGFMNYGVKPDIITMAKGITSAYLPLSATAVKREVYEAFCGSEPYDFFRHINTFGGHPAACAVALKNIEIMEKENLFDRSRALGEAARNELSHRLGNHKYVGDIRGKGLLIGIELVEDKDTKEPLKVSKVNQVIGYCKDQGILIGKNGMTVAGYNNVLTLSPPLTIEEEDMQLLLNTLVDALHQL